MSSCPFKEPRSFTKLKRDHRGQPVPYAMMQDPLSQITVDPRRALHCLKAKLCAVCGDKLKNKKWFIGGYRTMVYRVFVDGPMHEECARYALQVCPFLTNPKQKYHIKEEPDAQFIRAVAPKRGDGTQALMSTTGYQITTLQGTLVAIANEWHHIEYWRAGKQLAEVPEEAPTVEKYLAWQRARDDGAAWLTSYSQWAHSLLDWGSTTDHIRSER